MLEPEHMGFYICLETSKSKTLLCHLRMAEQVFYTGTGTRSLEIVSNLRIPNGMRGGAKSSKSLIYRNDNNLN